MCRVSVGCKNPLEVCVRGKYMRPLRMDSENKVLRDVAQQQESRFCKMCRKAYSTKKFLAHRNECSSSNNAKKKKRILNKRQQPRIDLTLHCLDEEDSLFSSLPVVMGDPVKQNKKLGRNDQSSSVESSSGGKEDMEEAEDSPLLLLAQLQECTTCEEFFFCQEDLEAHQKMYHETTTNNSQLGTPIIRSQNPVLTKSISDELDFDSSIEFQSEEEEKEEEKHGTSTDEKSSKMWCLDSASVQKALKALVQPYINNENVLNSQPVQIKANGHSSFVNTVTCDGGSENTVSQIQVPKNTHISPEKVDNLEYSQSSHLLKEAGETAEEISKKDEKNDDEPPKKKSRKRKFPKIVQTGEYYVRRAAAVNCGPYNLDICPYCHKDFSHTVSMERHISRFHEHEIRFGGGDSHSGAGDGGGVMCGSTGKSEITSNQFSKSQGKVQMVTVQSRKMGAQKRPKFGRSKVIKKKKCKEIQCSQCCGWYTEGISFESHLREVHSGRPAIKKRRRPPPNAIPRRKPSNRVIPVYRHVPKIKGPHKNKGWMNACSPTIKSVACDTSTFNVTTTTTSKSIQKVEGVYQCTLCEFSTPRIRSFYNHRKEHKRNGPEFKVKARRKKTYSTLPSSFPLKSLGKSKSVWNNGYPRDHKKPGLIGVNISSELEQEEGEEDTEEEEVEDQFMADKFNGGQKLVPGFTTKGKLRQPVRSMSKHKWTHGPSSQGHSTGKKMTNSAFLPCEYCAICSLKFTSPSELTDHFKTIHRNTLVTQINPSYDTMMELRTIKLCKKMVQIERVKERMRQGKNGRGKIPEDLAVNQTNCPRLIVKTRGSRVSSCFLVNPQENSAEGDLTNSNKVGAAENSGSHKLQLLQCEFCDKTFQSNGVYLIHVLHHQGVSICKCNPCGKLFVHSSHYNQHLITVHNRYDQLDIDLDCEQQNQNQTAQDHNDTTTVTTTTTTTTINSIIDDNIDISKRLLSPSQSKIVQNPLQSRNNMYSSNDDDRLHLADNDNNNNTNSLKETESPHNLFLGGSKSKMLNRRQCPMCQVCYQSQLALDDHMTLHSKEKNLA